MEEALQHWINQVAISPPLDHLMVAISNFSAWFPLLLLGLLTALWFGDFRLRAMLLTLALAIGLTDGITGNLLKHSVGRARPSQMEAGVRVVDLAETTPRLLALPLTPVVSFPVTPPPGTVVKGRSFPSGHATNNMAAATVIFLYYRRHWWGWFYFPVALLIGYSRIYTGAHWPTDVFAGALLGIVGGVVATWLVSWVWHWGGPRWVPLLAMTYPRLTD